MEVKLAGSDWIDALDKWERKILSCPLPRIEIVFDDSEPNAKKCNVIIENDAKLRTHHDRPFGTVTIEVVDTKNMMFDLWATPSWFIPRIINTRNELDQYQKNSQDFGMFFAWCIMVAELLSPERSEL